MHVKDPRLKNSRQKLESAVVQDCSKGGERERKLLKQAPSSALDVLHKLMLLILEYICMAVASWKLALT